jgi:hypothetical protein
MSNDHALAQATAKHAKKETGKAKAIPPAKSAPAPVAKAPPAKSAKD